MADRISNETELIQTYLAPLSHGLPGAFGLRDDAALIVPEPGAELVVTCDPIIASVHFLPSDRPSSIAWKALAVNVSDLAAKGAVPHAYILALAFPEAPQRAWMADFARGLETAQSRFGCVLAGGDTDRTPGPLSIGVTAFGFVPKGRFVPRQGAKAGDHVFVTGTIGDSALGLLLHTNRAEFVGALSEDDREFLIGRYLRPEPRVALASTLQACARAALDISDGFLKDLRRLAGGYGLRVPFEALPLSAAARKAVDDDASPATIVSGGDDFELLCSVPPDQVGAFLAGAASAGVAVSPLGVLQPDGEADVLGADGVAFEPLNQGYDHFAKGGGHL